MEDAPVRVIVRDPTNGIVEVDGEPLAPGCKVIEIIIWDPPARSPFEQVH